uniref:Uncharacterized protein n=1 Tax=Acrobeloides nanus TaxID=290746 RepID=A0A914E620_9BILA
MKEFRAAIIRMHERGTGKREIGRLLGIDESTVRKAIKRFEETGSNDNRKREKTARSSRNIQRANGMIKRNATTKVNSTRKLKKALKKAWKEINLETLIKTVDDFPKRLEACIAANGGYFE